MALSDIVINFFSVLTVIGNVILLMYVYDFVIIKTANKSAFQKFWKYLNLKSVHFILLISILATGGSLIFSDILKFEPCKLCWFQRIFIYPQLFLTSFALFKKDRKILPYCILLSIFGAFLALIHYISQISKTTIIPCSAVGYSASCSDYFALTFGYITIPFMALTAFLLILMLWKLPKNRKPY